MKFRYIAYTEDKVVRGGMEVTSAVQAEEALAQQGYRVLSLKPAWGGLSLEKAFPSLFVPRQGEVIGFTRQLATLLECGIGLLPALRTLQGQTKSGAFKRVLATILEDLSRGESFSAALAKHPQVFDLLYTRMVMVGEKAGQLESTLKQVASYMERQVQARKKIVRAMTYPTLVLVVAIGVLTILLTFALPPLLEVFKSFGAKLPLTTRILLFVSGAVLSHGLQMLVVAGALVLLALWFLGRPTGRRLKDRFLLRVPVLGPVVLAGEVARFSRMVPLLLRAGVTTTDSIELAAGASSNQVIKQALGQVQQDLLRGQGLSGPLSRSGVFPPLLVQMVVVGEETATLENSLSHVADFYETQVDEKVTAMITFLEPAMTLAVAGVVAFIAFSMITPMYSILGSVK